MTPTIRTTLVVSLIAVVGAHLVFGHPTRLDRWFVVAFDLFMVFLLISFVVRTLRGSIGRWRAFSWLVPLYAIACWALWVCLWIPVFRLAEALWAGGDVGDYLSYSYRFVVPVALSALVLTLGLPGIWWWKEGSGIAARHVLFFSIHSVLAIFLVLLVFTIPPTF